MDIKDVKDLRNITLTKEEYVKLGKINKYLTYMPLDFWRTKEVTRYIIEESLEGLSNE